MDDSSSSRRRRGAGVVTANACTECRKKRSKCDGQTPCLRCIAVKAECVYEIPIRQSKETMRAEIDALQTHRRQSERVFGALTIGPNPHETLNRLKNGETLEMIAEWLDQTASQAAGSSQSITTFPSPATTAAFGHTLRMAESAGNYMANTGLEASDEPFGQQTSGTYPTSHSNSEEPPSLTRPLVGIWSRVSSNESAAQSARDRGQQQILGPSYTEQDPNTTQLRLPGSTWTEVTNDIHLVEHLMALYFCWEYPTFASLSKESFLSDFRAGRSRYCSSLLVNAMLALGCRFANLPESRADPNDPTTSGDHFFAEAKRLLAEADRRSLTCIQAMSLISIREASYGHDSDGFYYAGQAIRLAVEAGLHLEADQSLVHAALDESDSVRLSTFWGAFALDQIWSLIVGRISHFSRAATLVAKPFIIDEVESSEWIPYTDEGVPAIKSANQPSNVRSVYKCFCELAELVHQSLYTLYAPERRLTTSELLAVYTRFLNWYSSLPEALRLGHNFTPAVLFAHMYYHFAILLLFQPFIKLHFIGSRVSSLDVCSQAADAIITLVRSYDQLYTLARTPSFVPYVVTAACVTQLVRIAHNANGAVDVTLTQFRQGVQDLKDMTVCHGFANRGLGILRFFVEKWELREILGEDSLPFNEVKDIVSPSSASMNFFCPYMGDDFHSGGLMAASTLFAPYPKQGLPMLAKENEMEHDGFRRAF